MSVCILDTSVFCNLVDVPGKNQQKGVALARLKELIREGAFLLLPFAAIVETGNHIGHVADGGLRRQVAERFRSQVLEAIDGTAPWRPTPFVEPTELRIWLQEFPDHAMRGLGMGDVSILKEWERQCQLHTARRVFIWAYDDHLSRYDRAPLL